MDNLSSASVIPAAAPVKLLSWLLRVVVFGEFLGYGILAIQGNVQWASWVQQLLGVGQITAALILTLVGLLNLIVAFIVLVRPIRIVLLWAVVWGFGTGFMRPLVGEQVWDFVALWANWGAPLALLLVVGWPKSFGQWLR